MDGSLYYCELDIKLERAKRLFGFTNMDGCWDNQTGLTRKRNTRWAGGWLDGYINTGWENK